MAKHYNKDMTCSFKLLRHPTGAFLMHLDAPTNKTFFKYKDKRWERLVHPEEKEQTV